MSSYNDQWQTQGLDEKEKLATASSSQFNSERNSQENLPWCNLYKMQSSQNANFAKCTAALLQLVALTSVLNGSPNATLPNATFLFTGQCIPGCCGLIATPGAVLIHKLSMLCRCSSYSAAHATHTHRTVWRVLQEKERQREKSGDLITMRCTCCHCQFNSLTD